MIRAVVSNNLTSDRGVIGLGTQICARVRVTNIKCMLCAEITADVAKNTG